MDLAKVVHHYKAKHRDRARAELKSFAEEPSLQQAVERAAWARTPDGSRYAHQRRRKHEALLEGSVHLAARLVDMEAARDFVTLHRIVEDAVGGVEDLGPLYIYDTALRIGAKTDVRPALVYLHAGTRDG